MAKAPPSFDFYYTNWLEGTDILSDRAYRCYLRLLIYQWTNGHIPETGAQRRRLCSIGSEEDWQVVWNEIGPKFTPIAAGDICDFVGSTPETQVLVNARMHELRETKLPGYLHQKEVNRANGRKGGRPKKASENRNANRIGFDSESETKAKRNRNGEKGEGIRENVFGNSSNTLGTPNRMDTQYGLENSKGTASDVGDSNTEHEKEVDSEPDRFGTGNFDILGIDGSSNPKIDDKAAHASRNERKAPDQCPISTEPIQPAPESILRVQKKTPEIVPASKPGKLDGPAKVLFNDRVQTVILPKGLDTRRVERAVQRWVDYCLSMGKLPQVMALENQLQEVARANPKEDDFVHAINRTIANNCDPHNFKPRLWAREWVGTAARPQPEREPDKIYNTLEQCRAAGAI